MKTSTGRPCNDGVIVFFIYLLLIYWFYAKETELQSFIMKLASEAKEILTSLNKYIYCKIAYALTVLYIVLQVNIIFQYPRLSYKFIVFNTHYKCHKYELIAMKKLIICLQKKTILKL